MLRKKRNPPQGDILVRSAEQTVAALWDIRPVECIMLQDAIDRYKDSRTRPQRLFWLESVNMRHAAATRK